MARKRSILADPLFWYAVLRRRFPLGRLTLHAPRPWFAPWIGIVLLNAVVLVALAAALALVFAAVGAAVALITDCTIEVERRVG